MSYLTERSGFVEVFVSFTYTVREDPTNSVDNLPRRCWSTAWMENSECAWVNGQRIRLNARVPLLGVIFVCVVVRTQVLVFKYSTDWRCFTICDSVRWLRCTWCSSVLFHISLTHSTHSCHLRNSDHLPILSYHIHSHIRMQLEYYEILNSISRTRTQVQIHRIVHCTSLRLDEFHFIDGTTHTDTVSSSKT